jgi:PRTRC genetic system ThiF family protein
MNPEAVSQMWQEMRYTKDGWTRSAMDAYGQYEKEKNMLRSVEDPKIEDLASLAFRTPSYDYEYTKRFLIIVAGVGGTGGYVVRDLSRFIYSINKRVEGQFDLKFVVVDPDNVEEKNLLRQNFLPGDLGKNKAEVIATRHSKAFQIEIGSVAEKLDRPQLEKLVSLYPRHTPIIIGCVDNNAARREISAWMKSNGRGAFWIDSGNEKTSGQVILGSNTGWPTVTDLFAEILDSNSDTVTQVSCAEALMQGEQNIFVNLTAANHVLNMARTVILNEMTAIHGVKFNINGKVTNYCLAERVSDDLGLNNLDEVVAPRRRSKKVA